ncbi:MAG TPA: type IV toxin-antitoxin system AbiEi family antitoxin, partial [Nocardioides sp.]
YVSSLLPDTLEMRARCAALVLPTDAVLCDRSAAWIWGIDVHDPDERFTIADLEVAVAPGHVRLRRTGISGVERDLAKTEITQVHGVRLTTPARTAIDLACLRGRRSALAALDAFMRQCGVSEQDLRQQLLRFRRRRGVTQARELVGLATPLAESPGESWTRSAIIEADLPVPEPQVEVFENGVLVARLDLAHRHCKVAVEFDGEEFHGEEQREHDERRREWLREQGWHVIVVRKHCLKGPALEAWLEELATVVAERSTPRRRRYARSAVRWQQA